MKVFVFILVVAAIAWHSYSLWHDGYTSGVMEERRRRIRSVATYQAQVNASKIELGLLQGELDDIKKRMPLTFNHECSNEPIGKVVYSEECDDGLKFRVEEVESNVRTAD